MVGEHCPYLTHRLYLTWQGWLDEQWNRPDRTDHYLMQIDADVRRGLVKKPNSVKISDCKLHFNEAKERRTPSKLTKDQVSAASMANWFGFFGGKVRIRDPITGEIRDPPKR